jgi:hypothetical protein
MAEPEVTQDTLNLDGSAAGVDALRQVAQLVQKQYAPLRARFGEDQKSFSAVAEKETRPGISAVRGRLQDEGVLAIHLECARLPGNSRVAAGPLFARLATLGDKCRVAGPPEALPNGEAGLWLELRVSAVPLSFAREAALVAQLENLDKLARTLQADLPRIPDEKEVLKLYERFSDNLDVVRPWPGKLAELPAPLADWVRDTMDFIDGRSSVALESGYPAVTQFLLAVLARAAADAGRTLGSLSATSMNARGLVDLVRKAPGLVAAPTIRISLGTNAYEMANEIACMLTSLSGAGTPVLFTGSHEQLQSVFGGGQGGGSDPLLPVLRHAPEVEIELLARFAIHAAGRQAGGLSAAGEEELVRITLQAVTRHHRATQRRILQAVAARTVAGSARSREACEELASAYAAKTAAVKETLAGFSARPRPVRQEEIQNRLTEVLTDRSLPAYFGEHLLAQEAALEQLTGRLIMECLTRPAHQPLRYCAQGTPGTGKSESAILLARRLGVPFINIDAASMPDYYTAAAQLLGSGRGIVGSYQSGRLEQASKCHSGAVIEVSDLDHAVPAVRSALADLFLQVLETGEAQSATGAIFSCANLIFAFTMNLPDGMDEAVRKRIGFNDAVSRRELTADVSAHIKRMLSGAFLSRVGTPIVFEPLDGAALAQIVERAIRAAVLSAAKHLHAGIAGVDLEEGLGARAVERMGADVTGSGARVLLEHGRSLASRAFLELRQASPELAGRRLRVSFETDGVLVIKVEQLGESNHADASLSNR